MDNKKLKFGGREYTISLKDVSKCLPEISKKHEIYGYVDYGNSKIVIEKNMSKDAIKENIIHEILHVLLDRKNLEIISKNSTIQEVVENLVEYLTPRFHAFLHDNPKFQKDFIKS